MGAQAALLVVGWRALLAAAVLLLAGCTDRPEPVAAEDYSEFFLWAGVDPQPVLDRARVVYLLDGEVRAGGAARLVSLRPGVPRIGHAQLWLVVRTERLDWTEATWASVLADLARWEKAGNRVAGLQIDFDAATRGLDRYGGFLSEARRRLPRRFALSITGLMDWSANGDPAMLARLAGTVDEVVVQTYQGRATIPGYAAYVDRLARLPIPHKLALVQHGEWRAPPSLARDPRFRGYVVFLVNPD